MKNLFALFSIFTSVLFVNALPIHAHCPLCTGAIGVAAASAKYYGMDTSIIGLFIGAFGISTGLWIGRKIKREYFKFQLPLIILLSFLLTVIPLRFISSDNIYIPMLLFGEPGSVFNKIYWIDNLLFGSILGGMLTLLAFWLHILIKKVRGRVLFPFQGIAITLALLIAGGLSLYFILG